jgi:hypothetical protein
MAPPTVTAVPLDNELGGTISVALAALCAATAFSCADMYSIGGSPRSMRSSLTTMNSCSGAGRLSSTLSSTSMGPTPSTARAASIDVSQSLSLGAMLAGGFDGGRIPAAPAAAVDPIAATTKQPATANMASTDWARERRDHTWRRRAPHNVGRAEANCPRPITPSLPMASYLFPKCGRFMHGIPTFHACRATAGTMLDQIACGRVVQPDQQWG